MRGQRLPEISRKLLLPLVFLFVLSVAKAGNYPNHLFGDPSIEGRWDLTVTKNGKELPSWLEVRHSGLKTLVGYFVAEGGSARPISRVNFENGKISFSIPPQWDRSDKDMTLEGTLVDGKLSGTILGSDGTTATWVGVRAPSLWRDKSPVWGKPITLFNGKNTNGWHASGENQWQAVNGVLTSARTGSNLISDQTFNDFKLHIEFRYPKESNSGVYLRGRYEVQVADNKGEEPLKDYFGAIYGFIEPTEQVAKAAGEWQSYDITLVGRLVTVVANGKTIICNRPIPGITGGALNSKEGEPGPIMIQGDHGPIEYRNIIITPAK
ncbi:3-keto-disaccharide hydrolase [Flavihumibacter profundi]|uniref:3-keto-disaccharide hydrolase n=1 Tax=Flavihumibacter profundi TaxID=2716883 RepID=UPI001CC363DF|nr:DUF1080 domain-containing protein [Flavihumibacter profundi]MBZ5858699.1 DUF1080 domain-containing protein [Flavihumibacter profundi]